MKKDRLIAALLAVSTGAGASVVNTFPWRDDSDLKTRLSALDVTHAVCFSKQEGRVRVAGVEFERTVDRNAWDAKRGRALYRVYNLEQFFHPKKNVAKKVQGEGAELLEQFLYTQLGKPVRLEQGGLVPGQPYRLVLFTQGWEKNPCARIQLVSSASDPIKSVDGKALKVVAPDRFGKRTGVLIVVDYVADAQGGFSIRFDPLDDSMSIQLAAFANFAAGRP